jgi:hypothetical protein
VTTTLDVDARLFFRKAVRKLGLAPRPRHVLDRGQPAFPPREEPVHLPQRVAVEGYGDF